MTWSYAHIAGSTYMEAGPFNFDTFNFVLRRAEAPFDSLSWEAYREGHDDAHYVTTLLAAAHDRGVDDPLIDETSRWLEDLDAVAGDLDAIRSEMVQRITALRVLGR